MLIVFLSAAKAMPQSGTVVYKETMKLEIHLDGDNAAMESMLPKERQSMKKLLFTPQLSLYLNSEATEDQEMNEQMEGGGSMVIKMEEPEERLYYNIRKQEVTDQRDFMSRTFLITSKADTLPWKLTGKQRDILGYQCLEATYVKDSAMTSAWFAPGIAISTGPANFRGLPGLILEVNVKDGQRIIKAASIEMADVSSQIIKPTKGKKMSKEEFNKMIEEKTGQQKSEGGAVIMIKMDK